MRKARRFKRMPRFAIGVTAIADELPERADHVLHRTQACAVRFSYVLDENETTTGLQHTQHFAQHGLLIGHRAQHVCTDNRLGGFGRDIGVFRGASSQIRLCQTQAVRCGSQIGVHIRVRLDADPMQIRRNRQIGKVRSAARADFHHGAMQIRQETTPVSSNDCLLLVITARHPLSENPLA